MSRVDAVLWDQTPDDALIQLLPANGATVAELAVVIRSMLEDPRAQVGVGAFYRWWLDLDTVASLHKDQTLFPDFTPAMP